ncbi:MAG: pilus assembly protein PilM, partial [bacterium]|nr:pilus assembly protein PilM [bacterium]
MDLSLFGIGKPSLIGLDIGSSTVKAVELNLKGKDKGFELKGL